MDRPNPGKYTPRQRLLQLLRHEQVDRLPIVPTALTPVTWHAEYPDYRPVLEVAARHCEFFPGVPLDNGLALCDARALDMKVEKRQEGDRKINTTTIRAPRRELTQVRVHEDLPFQMVRPDLSSVAEMHAKVGDAGVPYVNGINNALHLATGSMAEEFRIMFCFAEKDRLQRLVERAHERLSAFVDYVLDAVAPVPDVAFRWYAIEPYVEPIQPPSFIDRFVVPFDRELVKRIHDRGRYVITHCHGRLRAQISRMVQIGFDGVDCVESPPQNDATLAEMLADAGERMFLWGYIQFEELAHKTGEEVEAMVRDAIAMGGTTGRYVLGQAASPWAAHLPGDSARNLIRMIEAGVKYGGH
jgi:uroporphyrinogen-III decarboxylase